MYFYRVHGLCVASELVIPGLLKARGEEADAIIRLQKGELVIPAKAIASGENYRITEEGTYIFAENAFTLLIRNGCEVIVKPAPGVDEIELGTSVRGLLGVLLFQRGRFVLHASAVAINGEAIVFIGDHGQGKSTLVLALHARGHELLADDITSLDFVYDTILVAPAYPEVKASTDALSALSYESDALQRRASASERWVSITERFAVQPLRLRRIYALDEGRTTAIEPLSSHEALIELIRHSRRGELSETSNISAHLLQCAKLVRIASIRRLRIRRVKESIAEVARLVEEDALQEVQ